MAQTKTKTLAKRRVQHGQPMYVHDLQFDRLEHLLDLLDEKLRACDADFIYVAPIFLQALTLRARLLGLDEPTAHRLAQRAR